MFKKLLAHKKIINSSILTTGVGEWCNICGKYNCQISGHNG